MLLSQCGLTRDKQDTVEYSCEKAGEQLLLRMGKQTKLVQLIEVSTSCQLFGQLQGAWDNAACFPVTVQSNKKGNSSI